MSEIFHGTEKAFGRPVVGIRGMQSVIIRVFDEPDANGDDDGAVMMLDDANAAALGKWLTSLHPADGATR